MGIVVHWAVVALFMGCSRGDSDESPQVPTEAPRLPGSTLGTVSVRVVARDVSDPDVVDASEGCALGPAESVIVDAAGNLAGAAIWVDDAAVAPVDASVRLSNCRFDPRVVVLPVGARVTLRNDDAIEHPLTVGDDADVDDSDTEEVEPIASGEERAIELPDSEVAIVRLGPQPWEQVVVVRASQGIVTDEQGRGLLAGLPPGQHTVHVLHPVLGRRDAQLSVSPGKATMLEVLYRGQ